MIEFNWELRQILHGIQRGLVDKQANLFLRPHTTIWGDDLGSFMKLADSILKQLPSELIQRQFFSVCLGSYLLNPRKAPDSFTDWIQRHVEVSEIIGCSLSLEELKTWRWDRAAFPVLDEYENNANNTIYYALVASTKEDMFQLFPSWVSEVMNADALEAVTIAKELAQKSHPECRFFFWPFINPKKPTYDRSLGLPSYLSFLSLANCKPVPMFIASGEIDRQGVLLPVHGVFNKCDKAFEKKYKKFIYPDDGSCLEKRREQKPAGVANLFEAECQWGIRKKATVIDDIDTASLVRHVQTICSSVLGSDNLPSILISTFDTKHEEIPPNIIATHEYLIVVDIAKVRSLIPHVHRAFELFLGKKVIHYKTETINRLYWGAGEHLSK
jgi:hypothetical protein